MRCDEVKEILDTPKSAEGKETRPPVDPHVETCTSCTEFNQDLQAVEKAMSAIPEERMSAQGSVRLRNSIAMMIAEKERERAKTVAQQEAQPTFWDRVK